MKTRAILNRIFKKAKILAIPLTGLAALIWFLVRVIPKPTRAFYPCQKAAFPLAAGFIAWIISSSGSVVLFRKGKSQLTKLNYSKAAIFIFASLLVFITALILAPRISLFANNLSDVKVDVPVMKNLLPENITITKPLATVSIVKAAKGNASDLTYPDIKEMVGHAIEDAGGLGDIVSDGDTVVIKPNLVFDKEAASSSYLENEVNGITADWRIVKAVSEIVRELNPSGKIFIMEGSAISTQNLFDRMNYDVVHMPEVDRFYCIESSSGQWHEYDAPELKKVTLPTGIKLYPDNEKPYNSSEYYLNKLYYDADVLISIPLIKNHESASITGSIKNLSIGATPANIYGLSETNTNRGTINHGTYMHQWIHDFYLCRPADFAVMDGLQGLEFGPVSATSSQSYEDCKKNMRLILASNDLLALDAIEALLATYDPTKIKYMVDLHNDDVGCADPTYIKTVGAMVGEERQDFKHNKSTEPKFVDNIPPQISVSDISINDSNTLTVKIDSYLNIDKIEVAINNRKLENMYVSEFDSLVVDISDLFIDENSSMQLFAYNKYLAFTETNISNLLSGHHALRQNNNIRLYPSAVNDVLFIKGITNPAFLRAYDLSGKIVMFEELFSETTSLNFNNLKTGIYLVEIVGNGQGLLLEKVYKY